VLYLLNPTQGALYSSIVQTDDGNNADYNGLLLKIEHRLSHNIYWLANYTWSHCTSTYDFGGELAGNNYQNPNNRLGDRGPCNFDRRQIFNSSLVATSPALGRSAAAQAITGGWRVSPIVSFYNGQPNTPTDGGTDISLTGVTADRPNFVGSSNYYPHTLATWFDPTSFVRQPTGTFGNAGRDSIVNPGNINWDLSLNREFHMKENMRLEMRADFFNVMNHANWSAPTVSITSAQFGQVTSFGGPRLIQMALKLYF
jgi:hypothetical protein